MAAEIYLLNSNRSTGS